MIIPWQVDVPQDRYPVMNWLIIAVTLAAFVLQVGVTMEYQNNNPREEPTPEKPILGPAGQFVLNGLSIAGLLGHMWMHGGILHILGNLLFL